MFDIGWSEMALIALIALVVIGPKELPKAMRSVAKWVRKARSLAREFQSGVDDMIRDADLDDARKALEATSKFDVGKAVEDTIDPTGGLRDEAKDLQATARSAGSIEDGGEAADGGTAGPDESLDEAAESEAAEGATADGETADGETADGGTAAPAEATEPARESGGDPPANIAPPHSLAPAPETAEAAPSEEAPALDSDGSGQRARAP